MVQMNTTPMDELERFRERTAIPLSINNARQLGGIPLAHGRRVKDGVLLRTTQLFEATEEDLAKLRDDYHLALILDMRAEDEIRRMPDPAIEGARWVQTPIIDFEFMKESMEARFQGHREDFADLPEIDPENPDPEKVMELMIRMAIKSRETGEDQMGMGGGAYASYLAGPLGQEKIGLFFHELAATEEGAVLWHCYTGKDRTGIASGLILEVLGADWETIVEDYEVSNLYFAENVEKVEQGLRRKIDDDQIIAQLCGTMAGVHLPMLENAWNYMRQTWGGPVEYLKQACGVTEEELQKIRRRYSEPASPERAGGILMPVFSLPSEGGIGCFSKEAYDFVDFLAEAGQSYWQMLPLGPTGYGDSPYQPFSAFAGNPYFIAPDDLIARGWLTEDELRSCPMGSDATRVDYGALYEHRFGLLRKAFARFAEEVVTDRALREDYAAFLIAEKDWLEDYVLFTAIKQEQGGRSWMEWDEPLRMREAGALAAAAEASVEEMDFQRFLQYIFQRQWEKLHTYASKKGIRIIGDIPFYVAPDCADVWAHPELFWLDERHIPVAVAGCAPDIFSATGQLWGNPLYDWDKHAATDFDWWMRRMQRNASLADVIRFDHFHGFAAYYAVPYGAKTAENGEMHDGPGMAFFDEMKRRFPDLDVIAEDLGNSTPVNRKLLADSGFPGMKVLQFAFSAYDSEYLNHHHIKKSVVYTGTHDNPTIREWVTELGEGERAFVRAYIHSEYTDVGGFVWDFIREAYRSVADLCIVPLQDYLVKGSEARINTPSVAWGNWQWRLEPDFLSPELAKSIRGLAELYRRV